MHFRFSCYRPLGGGVVEHFGEGGVRDSGGNDCREGHLLKG